MVVASLVRSNAAGSVGFLREPERINVLLSRARHGMVLIGNSHTLRNAKSVEARRHWGVVLEKLEAGGAVAPGFPAVCVNHGTLVSLATPGAFAVGSPHGGCSRPCDHVLPCGHRWAVLHGGQAARSTLGPKGRTASHNPFYAERT